MADTLSSEARAAAGALRDRASHPLIGTWQTVSTSDVMENGDATTQPIEGYVIVTPSRLAVLYGSPESTDQSAGNGYKLAYTGTWTADGNAIQVAIDFSTSVFTSKHFMRYFSIEGSQLTLKSPLHESKVAPGVMKINHLVAERSAQ